MYEYQAFEIQAAGFNRGKLTKKNLASCSAQNVLVKVAYASLNYKDSLAVTGQGKILRKFPLVPGIDFSGVVLESKHEGFKVGDLVVASGCGLGESMDGGFSELVEIPGVHLIALPKELDLLEASIFGTAGLTAELAINRMQANDQNPDKGPIVVTGATGGVGSFAVGFLSSEGYEVVAVSGKKECRSYLKALGASEILGLDELGLTDRSLASARWGGAVDNLGGHVLSSLLATTKLWGNVASIGLAVDHKLESSVMPHILRGVNLLGISSANCPRFLREVIWMKLSEEMRRRVLHGLEVAIIKPPEIQKFAEDMLARKTWGRILIDFGSSQ